MNNEHLRERKTARLAFAAIACAAILSTASGCSLNGDPEADKASGPKTTAVYVSGYYYDDDSDPIPCYWKGSTRVDLPVDPKMGPFGAYANAIAVADGTVYVAGSHEGGDQSACYWKGASIIGLGPSKANAIRVVNGIVYTAVEGDCQTYYGAKYGIGTAMTLLPGIVPPPGSTRPYAGDFVAKGIDVAGGTIYTAGSCNDGTGSIACFWTGTARTDLAPGDYAYAVRASAGHVYVAGSYTDGGENLPCYWTDGVKTNLPPGASTTSNYSYAQAIEVVAGTVYTAGAYSNGSREVPCFWTGTTRTDLPDGGRIGTAQGIAVLGGVVYVAGSCSDGTKDVPCYWKGATRVDLAGGGTEGAYATGIVVVEE